ncbi:bZIP transcription factor [Purpureocillium lavendulum]|uniref:BZIP transcription factor n=1 Tax=Purpureocillium lavendulum TaxID=1247861 RepID=A0AB34FQC7_9HYPO|nr:bZIP transcription factor [Purpureocillium lavendulum]
MEPFTLRLANGVTVAGIANIPPSSTSGRNRRPLIVGIHGAGYSSHYFDSDATHAAKTLSDALDVPFVAFDRPGYGSSSPIGRVPDGSTFAEENATHLHQAILPALWTTFGARNGCACVVLHCHSLGTPSAIIAATLHAEDPEPGYPLGGIAFSGIGSQSHPDILAFRARQWRGEPGTETLQDLMLPRWAADADVIDHDGSLRQHPPVEDIETATQVWAPRWRADWAPRVQVSMLVGLAGRDRIWEGSREHLRDIAGGFTACPTVEELLLPGAPHNIEMSYWAPAWYARTFGFALDCALSYEL